MKKVYIGMIAVVAVLALSPLSIRWLKTNAQSQPLSPETKPLYRLYNGSINDHIYVTSNNEREFMMQKGYKDEGVMGYVLSSPQLSTPPIYKMYSTNLNNHFYTTDTNEALVASRNGFKLESVVGYLNNEGALGFVKRLYHPTNGDHLYTTSDSEKDVAIKSGYRLEGMLSNDSGLIIR